jgi:hydroxyacylglutathione hydrolase
MITIKIFIFNDFQENTFVLSDETKECIIIDPGCNEPDERKELTDYIEKNGFLPKAILNTHCHIDHVLGCKFIVDLYKIPFIANREDIVLIKNALSFGSIFGINAEQPPMPDKTIDEGEEFEFGKSTLKIFHVPGHSSGSISLYSVEDKFVITGDVLFKNSIGRTDLPGGDYDTLIKGIKTKLLTLPEDTLVFPGHGPHTTIKEELKNNPFLK